MQIPFFTDADGADNVAGTEDDDLSLQSGSPAIDAASSSVANYPSTDLLGSTRSGNPEMGAYEYGANSLPTIFTGSSVSMAENTTAVVTINASDPDGDSLAYSISGGADQALFTINASTGELVFNTAPDYESPGDSGADNVYDLQIAVSDGSGSSTLDLGVTVTNVNEAPVISTGSSVSVSENTTAVVTVNATDPDAGSVLTYSISGGADQALFTINASTGALVFNTAPDYESPGDSGADNVYNLQIEVSDGSVSSTLDLGVTVTNVNEAPVMSTGSSVSVSENTTAVVTVSATDQDAGSVLIYLISGGADQALFTINANTGALVFNTAPDYESPADSGADNIYELQVSVSDGINPDSINLSVTVTDLNEPNQSNHVVNLNDSVSLEMIWVESGTFTMGSPVGEAGRNANETAHQVTLTEGFYLGKYEVTQAQYEVVMTGNTDVGSDGNIVSATPSNWPNNPDYPVEMVSWDDIQIFLSRLNSQQSGNIPTGWAYVLPTEAEWEYACRAGTSTLYSWGDTISTGDANYQDSGNAQPEDVGGYPANPWGFFDMHGNVFERVQDFYQVDLGTATVIDPLGAQSGSPVIKGGSWFRTGDRLRSAYRSANAADLRSDNVGFRLGFKQINQAPANLNSAAPLVLSENQPVGTSVGIFTATDPDTNPTISYHLVSGTGDADNSLFTLESNGSLLSALMFDYESNPSTFSIRVQARDEFNASVEGQFTVTLQDRNEAPTITSLNSFSISENQSVVTNVSATDPEVDNILFSISGGADSSFFSIDSVSGQVTFTVAPDYELPGDTDLNNQYNVDVRAMDPSGLSDTQSITVLVTDTNEAPVISSGTTFSVVENGATVTTVAASDPEGGVLSFSIVGGGRRLL